MIVNFSCKISEGLWGTGKSKKIPPEAIKVALRKLLMIDSAHTLKDLTVPANNHLESLYADRIGPHSIRINKRWRIFLNLKIKKHMALKS